MTAGDAAGGPRPKLRPAGSPTDQRPAGPVEPSAGSAPPGRTVPVRAWLLAGLGVLLLLAVFRPGGVAAVLGVPLAVALPGTVLQLRFLPGLRTDPVTRWCLRGAVSLAAWVVAGLAVGAAGIPPRSVWTVVVVVVLLASVVVGEPAGGHRFGAVPLRHVLFAVVAVVVATAVALGARGLVGVAGSTTGPAAAPAVVLSFADPTVPLSLSATGAQATVGVVVTNTGDHTLHLTLAGRVGRALPWPTVPVDVAAGATRTVEVTGGVPVCSDPQQAIVEVEGVAPLSTVVPGAAMGAPCVSS